MNIEEVQAALADKIDSMRRQTLTLDIPEYEDVKQTFQVLLNTIEERDRDILVLQQHISQMAQSMADEQDKVELLNARVNQQEEKMKILEVGPSKVDVDVGVLIKESSRVHMSRVTSPGDQLGEVFLREDLETIEDSLNNSVVVSEPGEEAEFKEEYDDERRVGLDDSKYQSPSPMVDGFSFVQLKESLDALESRHLLAIEGISKNLEEVRSEADSSSKSRVEALGDRLHSEIAELRSILVEKQEAVFLNSASTQTSIILESAVKSDERDDLLFSSVKESERIADDTMISNEATIEVVVEVDSLPQGPLTSQNEISNESNQTTSGTVKSFVAIDGTKTAVHESQDSHRHEFVALIKKDFDAIRLSLNIGGIDAPDDFASFMFKYHTLSGCIQQLNSLNLSLNLAILSDLKNSGTDDGIYELCNEIRTLADSVAMSIRTLIISHNLLKFNAPQPSAMPSFETASVMECKRKLDDVEAKFGTFFVQQDMRLSQLEASRVDDDDIDNRILTVVKDRIPVRVNDTITRKDDVSPESLWKIIQPLVMKTVASEIDRFRAEMSSVKDITRPTSPRSHDPTHTNSGISRKETQEFDDETDVLSLLKEMKVLRADYRHMSAALSQMKQQVKKATEMAISKSAGSSGIDSAHETTAMNVTPMRRKSFQRSASLLGHSDLGDTSSDERAHQVSPSGKLGGNASISSSFGVTSPQSAVAADAELQLRLEQELARISSAVQSLTVSS